MIEIFSCTANAFCEQMEEFIRKFIRLSCQERHNHLSLSSVEKSIKNVKLDNSINNNINIVSKVYKEQKESLLLDKTGVKSSKIFNIWCKSTIF